MRRATRRTGSPKSADSSQWTANVTDLIGSLALTVSQAGTATYQYADLHGDVVATATSAVNGGAAVIGADYGEFGTNPGANTRYGWLGGKQRSSDDLGGITLMAVRLYNPVLGRFLSTDPVPGGSANDYDYASQDPINGFDLGGAAVFAGSLAVQLARRRVLRRHRTAADEARPSS